MLTLNLLSEQYKRAYAFEIKIRFAVFFCVSLLAIFVIFTGLLFSVFVYLKIQTKSIEDNLDAQKKALAAQPVFSLERDIKNLNVKIGALSKARSEIFPLAPALERISSLIKQGAYLKSFSIDNKTGMVSIMGFATDRDLVLRLNDDFSSDNMIAKDSVQSPIQNILKERKIDFTFTFQLNK